MLERYRLGEMLPGDRKAVEEILAADESLRSRLAALEESDRELRGFMVPLEELGSTRTYTNEKKEFKVRVRIFRVARSKIPIVVAAAILLCFFLPVMYYLRVRNALEPVNGLSVAAGEPNDRAKGTALTETELSVYLKSESEFQFSDSETPLADSKSTLAYPAVLHEGNTVQLAYTAPAGDYYGVIFSIDGRAEVTMHYPYRRGQSSRLVSGRKTFLDEAYTLDDAPAYEVFVMVISGEPLDVEAVLLDAQRIAAAADLLSVDLRTTEGRKKAFGPGEVFEGCEVETLTVLKK